MSQLKPTPTVELDRRAPADRRAALKRLTLNAQLIWNRHQNDLLAAIIVAIVIVIGGYSEVALGGKTFNTAQISAGVNACKPSEIRCPIVNKARNDPRFDVLPQPWALDPWAHVVSAQLRDREVPLWTPYQGAGAPLAANSESGVFDPLLLAVNQNPTLLTWDITFLIVLALNGIATFALARVIGLRRWAAGAAGIIYGLSGFFFQASNNSFMRVHLYMPVTLLAIEWILRRRGLVSVVAFAFAVCGCVLVGMPEPVFIVLIAAMLYGSARLFTGPRLGSRADTLTRLALGGAAGLMLAAPLLLPFAEYLGQAKTFKHGAGASADPRLDLLNWAAPKIQSSIWNGTRNWVGAAAIVAAIAGIASPPRMRRHCGWAFLTVGLLLALKIYGAPVVSLVSHLPAASETLWPTWGMPEIALPIALLAGIGIESVFAGGPNRWLFGGALLAGLVITGGFVLSRQHDLRLGLNGVGIGGWGLALLASSVAVVLITWRRPRLAGVLIVLVIVAELLLLVPRGFYSPRRDPYPHDAWIEALAAHVQNPGNSRIFSTDGLLFPDTASVYRLADLRVIDAIYVDRYFKYFQTFVAPGTVDRWLATGPTEGFPSIFNNPMFDLMGARYLVQKRPFATSDPNYHLVETVNGHLIYENSAAFPRAFVVHNVHVVKDEAGSIAFLKHGSSRDVEGAVHPAINPRTEAVVEAPSTRGLPFRAADRKCPASTSDSATITQFSPSRLQISVTAKCAGVVVVSDTYFPGWRATVNGRKSDIYPADLAFRGIAVPAGRTTIVLRYRPPAFRDGVAISVFVLLSFVIFGVSLAWRRRRRSTATDSADDS